MTRKGKSPDFEQTLRELEELVSKLEGGELPLDEALRTFERGVFLTRQCQDALKAAQAKVDILVAKDGEAVPEPFDPDEDDESQ